jgi:negative regulator of sigma E activity
MSKARQIARAERERLAAERAAAAKAEAAQAAELRARQERRSLLWRRLRLWQHGPAFRRQRETWGALATVVLLVLLVVYLFSRSWSAVFATALALVVCTPVLVLLFFDRSRR